MILTYRYRIKDARCAAHLREMATAVNQVWNYCGGVQNDSRRLNRRWPTAFDLIRLTTGSAAMLGLHSDAVQAVCKEFAKSRDKARRRPRWRVSRGSKRSLGWIPFAAARAVRVDGDAVVFLRKRYRLWLSRPINGEIRSGCFAEDASGRWYLNLAVEVAEAERRDSSESVGIDLGLKDLASLSDGTKISNPRHIGKSASKLAQAQRAGRKRLARRIHARLANQRKDFLHRVSTDLVRRFDLIAVGNVSSARLAKTNMGKSVLDAGWAMLRSQLRYKAIRHGVVYMDVDERYSSQVCSTCGALPTSRPRGIADLGVRTWVCSDCGALHDRDQNAARNILRSAQNLALRLTEIPAIQGAGRG